MAAALVLVLATASGCLAPAGGGDRNLVDDWKMLAAAKVPEPKVGECWTSGSSDVYEIMDVPGAVVQSPCENQHVIETAYVGHFTGPQADADREPSLDELAEQYKTCQTETEQYLGGPWMTGRVRMLVLTPTSTQWKGGARYFACDVAALRSEAGIMEPRKETLKGTVQAGGPMALGCSVQVGARDNWDDLTPAACTEPHDVEFVGVIPAATSTYPADDKASDAAWGDLCWSRIRTYTHSSNDTLDKADVHYGYWGLAGEDEWKLGVHEARCYMMLPKKITRSLKDNGTTAI